ncbi:MAG: hypothetical protein ACTSXQ_06355 [Alphaproteobacteria bacterium]
MAQNTQRKITVEDVKNYVKTHCPVPQDNATQIAARIARRPVLMPEIYHDILSLQDCQEIIFENHGCVTRDIVFNFLYLSQKIKLPDVADLRVLDNLCFSLLHRAFHDIVAGAKENFNTEFIRFYINRLFLEHPNGLSVENVEYEYVPVLLTLINEKKKKKDFNLQKVQASKYIELLTKLCFSFSQAIDVASLDNLHEMPFFNTAIKICIDYGDHLPALEVEHQALSNQWDSMHVPEKEQKEISVQRFEGAEDGEGTVVLHPILKAALETGNVSPLANIPDQDLNLIVRNFLQNSDEEAIKPLTKEHFIPFVHRIEQILADEASDAQIIYFIRRWSWYIPEPIARRLIQSLCDGNPYVKENLQYVDGVRIFDGITRKTDDDDQEYLTMLYNTGLVRVPDVYRHAMEGLLDGFFEDLKKNPPQKKADGFDQAGLVESYENRFFLHFDEKDENNNWHYSKRVMRRLSIRYNEYVKQNLSRYLKPLGLKENIHYNIPQIYIYGRKTELGARDSKGLNFNIKHIQTNAITAGVHSFTLFVETMAHETAHEIQSQLVDNLYKVESFFPNGSGKWNPLYLTALSFKINNRGFVYQPEGVNYRKQPVEKDALWMGDLVKDKLMNYYYYIRRIEEGKGKE